MAYDKTKTPVVDENIVYGRNAVAELLKSGRETDKLFVRRGEREGSITTIVALALKARIPVIEVDAVKLTNMCGTTAHQGVCAVASAIEYVDVDDIIAYAESKGEKPFIVIADGVEDPQNIGALLRCCECAGVHGLIIPKRRSASVNSTAVKASAGAAAYVKVARVPNIAMCVDELKNKGLWLFCSEAGGSDYTTADFSCAAAVVFGSEGEGVSRLVREKCDYTVSIPMFGNVNSLNVSCAAAVILSFAAKQKHISAQ